MANATRAGTTLLRSCLCRSAVAVRPFAHLRILYAGPGCKSGPAGFKAGQAFTAVYNRASRLYSRPARFKTGRPAIKPAAGFQAGQVYNRALTYIYRRTSGFDCVVKRLRMALYKPDCDFNDCELPSGQYIINSIFFSCDSFDCELWKNSQFAIKRISQSKPDLRYCVLLYIQW